MLWKYVHSTKKKELIGAFDNPGQQWRPAKQPRPVQGHDFPTPAVPRAYPCGIYDIGRNTGFVNLGTDHDTAAFAVVSIGGWWRHEGQHLYPAAATIVITADAGGSNGSRLRLWKLELQRFADDTGLPIAVRHFPPGTSKWNKIEHRLFSFISSNWRGEPLQDYETAVNLIAATTTAKGLTVTCRLDRRTYKTGRKVTTAEMTQVRLYPETCHGDWNDVIRPHGGWAARTAPIASRPRVPAPSASARIAHRRAHSQGPAGSAPARRAPCPSAPDA